MFSKELTVLLADKLIRSVNIVIEIIVIRVILPRAVNVVIDSFLRHSNVDTGSTGCGREMTLFCYAQRFRNRGWNHPGHIFLIT